MAVAGAGLSGRCATSLRRVARRRPSGRRPPCVRASGGAVGVAPARDAAAEEKQVVAATSVVLLVATMCRICLSVAVIPLSKEYGWSGATVGLIQSSFLWGYTATQVLGGALADKYGGRLVLAAGIAWFSVFTAVLPLVMHPAVIGAGLLLPAVLLVRVCVGLGEGVAMPTMNNMMARYVAPERRTAATGVAFLGFHSGNVVGLFLSPFILLNFGWEALFYVYGAIGIPLLAYWLAAVPQQPATAAAAPGGKADAEDDGAMQKLLKTPAVWACVMANIVNHWTYFTYLNWLPSYFSTQLGINLKASTLYSMLPWVAIAACSYLAGWLADTLVARGWSKTHTRKSVQTVAFAGPALALFPLITTTSTPVAVTLFTIAMGLSAFGQAGFIANIADIAPTRAGVLFGVCNTAGSIAGVLATNAAGVLVDMTGSFSTVFGVMVAFYAAGVIMWLSLCKAERVV